MSAQQPSDSDSEPSVNEAEFTVENESAETASLENTGGGTRREFLGTAASAGLVAGGLTAKSAGSHDGTKVDSIEDLFQPEEYWSDRMKAPDDGKKFGWFIDTRRCFGCHGCEVACKAENDVPLGNYIRQTFFKDVGEYPKVARMFLPMACQHCEDAPCVKACPCGALKKSTGGSVIIDYETCCGHATCVEVCPYGAIYIDPVANQAVKCHNCYHRLEHDMEPACASTCPSDAIYFGDLNDPNSKVTRAMAAAKEGEIPLVQLRGEKNTKPRMWFSGPAPAEIEARVPREGESYNNDAYNIYNWKEKKESE